MLWLVVESLLLGYEVMYIVLFDNVMGWLLCELIVYYFGDVVELCGELDFGILVEKVCWLFGYVLMCFWCDYFLFGGELFDVLCEWLWWGEIGV